MRLTRSSGTRQLSNSQTSPGWKREGSWNELFFFLQHVKPSPGLRHLCI